MSTIRFLGFIRSSEVAVCFDRDVEALITCCINGWADLHEVWIRDLPEAIEVAIVITPTRDRKSIETLIKVDGILDGLRARKFQVGEIQPGDLARYVLVTIRKDVQS